jgi:capsular polysaccharide biosynthesis protein
MTEQRTDNLPAALESDNLLVMLYKWRKPIIIATAAAAIISAAVSFTIQERFKSTVILFAEQQHSFGAQLVEFIQKEDLLTFGEEEDAERLMEVINSNQVIHRVIENFDLWSVYGINKGEIGSNSLISRVYQDNVSARLTKFGSIEIAVLDADPNRAKDMANFIAAYSDTVANKMRSDRALQAYQYADASLKEYTTYVKNREDSLHALQLMGVYSYTDQIGALTGNYARAIAQGHPKRAQELKNQLIFLSNYGMVYKKIEIEVTDGYERLGVLRKRHELLKIDAESNIPVMRIVDYAVAADKKSFPIRWLIVAMSSASMFVFIVIFLLIRDNIIRLRKQGTI